MPNFDGKVNSIQENDPINIEASVIATALGINGMSVEKSDEVIEKICELDSNDFTFSQYREIHALIKQARIDSKTADINPADVAVIYGHDFADNLIKILQFQTVTEYYPNIDSLIHRFRNAAVKRKMAVDFEGLKEKALNGKTPRQILESLNRKSEQYQDIIHDELPDIAFSRNRNAGRLTETPGPREMLAYAANQGFLPAGVVGSVISDGGAGKTSFLIQFLTALAGGQAFAPFEPVRPLRCMMLAAEDDQAELDRRLCAVTGGPENIPENLCILSVMGKAAPLMRLDGANPERTDWFRHLDRTLAKDPVDVLVLDTLSRFYGLTENSNEHAAAFISSLETLAVKHKLTLLYTHHTGKASRDSGKQGATASRGASALTDNARWILNLERISGADAYRFGVDHQQLGDYIKIRVSKSNYSAITPYQYFKRSRLFCFEHINPEKDRLTDMSEYLVGLLSNAEQEYTARELHNQPIGKEIADTMKENFPGFNRGKDMKTIINNALSAGMLKIETRPSGKIMKDVLTVPERREDRKAGKVGKNNLPAFNDNEINMIKPGKNKAGKNNLPAFNGNEINMIKPGKNHPLKGGNGTIPPFSPAGNFGPELPGNEPEQSCFSCHHQQHDFCAVFNLATDKAWRNCAGNDFRLKVNGNEKGAK